MWSAGPCTWRCAKGSGIDGQALPLPGHAPGDGQQVRRPGRAQAPGRLALHASPAKRSSPSCPISSTSARTYLGVDPVTQPMPIQPTAHYAMGGIPTNKYGEVVIDEKNTVLPGLYAAGECACVSVHGANRLGTNSLLDLIVFGKHAGLQAAEYAKGAHFQTAARRPDRVRPRSSSTPSATASGKEKALRHRQRDEDRSCSTMWASSAPKRGCSMPWRRCASCRSASSTCAYRTRARSSTPS